VYRVTGKPDAGAEASTSAQPRASAAAATTALFPPFGDRE
jgi:hypothetical protein